MDLEKLLQKNPYGDEWWTSACQHQYNLGEAYQRGVNEALWGMVDWLKGVGNSYHAMRLEAKLTYAGIERPRKEG